MTQSWTAEQARAYFTAKQRKAEPRKPKPGRRPAVIRTAPTEHQEQAALMDFCKYHEGKYPALALLHAVPNGGHRNKATAGKLKAEGVKPGVQDLDLPVSRGGYHGLRIEMKRSTGGRESSEQRQWREALTREGYCCRVCYGWREAWNVIEWYLNLDGGRDNA